MSYFISRWARAFILGLGIINLSACETSPQHPETQDAIEATLNEGINAPAPKAPKTAKPPPEVSAALLPPLSTDRLGTGVSSEPHFDIAVNKVPAQQFFMNLVEGTPYNMVVHPKVEGEITLNLKNVTIPEVMDTVRSVFGYDFQYSKTGYQVLPATLQSRIFKVDYLTVNRRGNSQIQFSPNRLSSAGNTSGSPNPVNTQAAGAAASSGSEISTVSDSDFWTELTTSLKAIIGTEGNRNVVVSPQSGIIVVRAMPDELREVEEFLKASQSIIQRQVILEAKILEVELNDGFQSGINWALLSAGDDGEIVAGQRGAQGGALGEPDVISGVLGATGVANSAPFAAANGIFSMALVLNNFTTFIELLKTQGNVQVLSSPRISTVNNQKAVIKVGSDEFFVTGVSTTQTGATTGTTTQPITDVELTPFFSGITLDVIPQISEDGDVILHIHPAVSQVTDQRKDFTVGGRQQSLPLALSSTRESDSIIRAKNGQLVVIGGLMQDTTRRNRGGIPVLSDAPGVGSLFRHTRNSSRKSELVILLRPLMIDDQQQWAQSMRQSAASFRSLRRDDGADADKDVVITPSGQTENSR